MKFYKEPFRSAYIWKLREFLRNIRRNIWNKTILLWWYRLWIRKDEFHISLSTDLDALLVMTPEEKDAYYTDLMRRRSEAHARDIHARDN